VREIVKLRNFRPCDRDFIVQRGQSSMDAEFFAQQATSRCKLTPRAYVPVRLVRSGQSEAVDIPPKELALGLQLLPRRLPSFAITGQGLPEDSLSRNLLCL
jgi:hypothetical protein